MKYEESQPQPDDSKQEQDNGPSVKYQKLAEVGKGTYGTVYKALDRYTGHIVAIKKMSFGKPDEGIPPVILRETAILRDLHHPNIVHLESIIVEDTHISLVFEFVETDLKKYMESFRYGLGPDQIKKFLFQLLLAVRYLHSKKIFHRDIKPQNILVDSKGCLKLTDFGLSRHFGFPLKTYTREVVTLYYRAPEIFLGDEHYLAAIDVWSIGCIFAEMVNNDFIFQGETEVSILFTIFHKLGTPTEETWPGVSQLPNMNPNFPHWPQRHIRQFVPSLEPQGQDLLEKMLILNPEERISTKDALDHPYFDDIRDLYPSYE
ncbi:hypothetical protein WA158_007167 [Blastocystis sp. Blastoise]